MPLQSLTGEELPHARLFVHVALTNRRGGGKPHKRGLSVRKARKGRDYTALRDLGVRAVDDVFKMAAPLLREATDLRENMQVGDEGASCRPATRCAVSICGRHQMEKRGDISGLGSGAAVLRRTVRRRLLPQNSAGVRNLG